ncbi:ABC transporter permease [Sinomonas atrocyanea]|uniref:ABC transporter permease n=1 Tax=Sinomonas atrocyanea TaxID=37927 RepID=A0A127A5W7_9MICC|nr:EamA family transporter [Sinomonas atrocyanea]AMM34311.1 ABC transporter permease [Sinomonas atrocyanea]GEB66396.1 ABC transporter permease [Sinomonas atrocyanea]GGG63563.1 ABC transporter permease [Sinomonas atrocyanea]
MPSRLGAVMKSPALAPATAALAPAVWGSTYLVTAELLPPDRPLLASVMRALPAGLMLVALTRARLPRGFRAKTAALGVLNVGAFFYLLFVAAYRLPGGVAALVLCAQPMLVLLLNGVVLKQGIRAAHAAACGSVAVGISLLVLTSSAQLDAVGVVAGLGAAACMAAGIVLTKKWGKPPTMGNLAFTGWQLTFGGLFLAPMLVVGEGLPQTFTAENLLGFSYLGIVGAALTYWIWFKSIEALPTIAVSFLAFASPLTAAVLGFLFRGEAFTPIQALGALVIVGSIVSVQPRPPRLPRALPSPAHRSP